MASRHEWVDYSKGICIVGVVTLYATQHMARQLGVDAGWMQWWADFAKPFRMPDFFLLSGLFLARSVDRPWRRFIDTKVVHYLYFYVVWTLIYFASKVIVGRAGDEPSQYLANLAWDLANGFAMLWFIAVLPAFFIVARLTRNVPWQIALPAATALQMLPLHGFDWLLISHFSERFVFFYIGFRFAPLFFALAQWAASHVRLALAGVLAWIFVNETLVLAGVANDTGIAMLTGLAGCSAVVACGELLSRSRWMGWLRYLGANSIVTYLAFFMPMSFLLMVMKHTGVWIDEGVSAALLSIASIAFALLLAWATRDTPARILFQRPGWARVDRPRMTSRLADGTGA